MLSGRLWQEKPLALELLSIVAPRYTITHSDNRELLQL